MESSSPNSPQSFEPTESFESSEQLENIRTVLPRFELDNHQNKGACWLQRSNRAQQLCWTCRKGYDARVFYQHFEAAEWHPKPSEGGQEMSSDLIETRAPGRQRTGVFQNIVEHSYHLLVKERLEAHVEEWDPGSYASLYVLVNWCESHPRIKPLTLCYLEAGRPDSHRAWHVHLAFFACLASGAPDARWDIRSGQISEELQKSLHQAQS